MNLATPKATWNRLGCAVVFTLCLAFQAHSDDALRKQASWKVSDADQMAQMLRESLDEMGVLPAKMDKITQGFLDNIEKEDLDPMDAYVRQLRPVASVLDDLMMVSSKNLSEAATSVDPNTPGYAALEALPKSVRMTARTWLGRQLVRQRFYDEALPVIAEVDAAETISPESVLFYRGACYHALLMKKEALSDLNMLLENEGAIPNRYERTAKMMIADISPLKEDSLDEISRLMTDVTRRLELGRSDDDVQDREQKIIDKLSKLIDKIEQQQQQQQQQQSSGGQSSGSPQNGQGSPMQDSQAAGDIGGRGDVDNKKLEDRNRWGNLPPAERKQALQQISRDLPTHHREAIEAYFRKLATDGN